MENQISLINIKPPCHGNNTGSVHPTLTTINCLEKLIYILPQSPHWCVQYHVILDRVIMALNCICLIRISIQRMTKKLSDGIALSNAPKSGDLLLHVYRNGPWGLRMSCSHEKANIKIISFILAESHILRNWNIKFYQWKVSIFAVWPTTVMCEAMSKAYTILWHYNHKNGWVALSGSNRQQKAKCLWKCIWTQNNNCVA